MGSPTIYKVPGSVGAADESLSVYSRLGRPLLISTISQGEKEEWETEAGVRNLRGWDLSARGGSPVMDGQKACGSGCCVEAGMGRFCGWGLGGWVTWCTQEAGTEQTLVPLVTSW